MHGEVILTHRNGALGGASENDAVSGELDQSRLVEGVHLEWTASEGGPYARRRKRRGGVKLF
jgi:hypothetical protein